MSIERVVFFNPCNNGDIHVSRELVKVAIRSIRALHPAMKFAYAHRNPRVILLDLEKNDGLEHWALERCTQLGEFDPAKTRSHLSAGGATLWLNTWYCASPAWSPGGDGGSGLSLNTLVTMFASYLHNYFQINIRRDPIETFIPSIDWKHYSVNTIMRSRAWGASRRVLFCNGPAMSGQSNVHDVTMSSLMCQLAADYRDLAFFYTQEMGGSGAALPFNLLAASAVIGTPKHGPCDLNEIAYLGSRCDVVIGRVSGPHSFCFHRDFLLDPKKTSIGLVSDERTAQWLFFPTLPTAKMIWRPETDLNTLLDRIAPVLAA